MNPAGDNSTPGQEKENLIPASQVSSMNRGGYNTPAAGQGKARTPISPQLHPDRLIAPPRLNTLDSNKARTPISPPSHPKQQLAPLRLNPEDPVDHNQDPQDNSFADWLDEIKDSTKEIVRPLGQDGAIIEKKNGKIDKVCVRDEYNQLDNGYQSRLTSGKSNQPISKSFGFVLHELFHNNGIKIVKDGMFDEHHTRFLINFLNENRRISNRSNNIDKLRLRQPINNQLINELLNAR